MRLCSPRLFLALCLFTTSSLARAQASVCQTQVRHIELKPGSRSPAEICISPNLSTTVLFDRKLATEAVVLEGRARFRRVEVADDFLILLPSERLAPGERLRLEVRFAGGEAPVSAAFVLVVHSGQAERQVEVSRASHSASACQVELQRQQEELQQCRAQRVTSPPTIMGVLAAGLISRTGISVRPARMEGKTLASAKGLEVLGVMLYHSAKRIVVEVQVKNAGHERPWILEGAALRGQAGEVLEGLLVAQSLPLARGTSGPVWVELELPSADAHRSFTLELWDAGRASTLTLPGLRLQ